MHPVMKNNKIPISNARFAGTSNPTSNLMVGGDLRATRRDE